MLLGQYSPCPLTPAMLNCLSNSTPAIPLHAPSATDSPTRQAPEKRVKTVRTQSN